jgi:predicted ATPase
MLGGDERTGRAASIEAPGADVFVGRQRELADLRARLDEVDAGSGQLVLIAGEAGIGKTRLAEEITREAAERGATVAWARSREGEGAPPYWSWMQVLRAWLEHVDLDALGPTLGAGAPYIAELLPELRERDPLIPQAPTSPVSQNARFYLFDAIASFVRNAARHRSLVLAFDDLQWTDVDSLLLLEFVAGQARTARVLLLSTYRDAEARQTPRSLVASPPSHAAAGISRSGA